MSGGAHHRLYGLHAVRALLARRPHAVRSAKVLEGSADGRLAEVVQRIESFGVPVTRAKRAELDRASEGGAHQGIVIEVAPAAELTLGAFEDMVVATGTALRLLVLDGVEDPRNLGACLRTADAAGMHAVVVPRSRSAKLTAAALKVATGAAETVPVLEAPNLARVLTWLASAGVRLVGADAEASRTVYQTALEPPLALVLGGEGRGLRRLTREACDTLVSIPMHGAVASLNVSVAAALLMYELVRQAPPQD